jgi:hypothetical protein
MVLLVSISFHQGTSPGLLELRSFACLPHAGEPGLVFCVSSTDPSVDLIFFFKIIVSWIPYFKSDPTSLISTSPLKGYLMQFHHQRLRLQSFQVETLQPARNRKPSTGPGSLQIE